MTQSSESIFNKYTKSRLRSIEEEKYSAINNIHYMMESDKKHRSLILEIITDAAALSSGESFSVDDLFNDYHGPHVEIVNNLKKFIDIVCYKHRAEEAYCRRMVCLIVSLASNGDLESAMAAYRFFSFSSTDLAARINAPAILGKVRTSP